MRSDIRYALRVLARAPGFTLAVVLVLALGIGANTAIFSAVDTAVIRPLPYRDPGHLAMLWEDFSAFGVPKNRVSPATFLDWRERSQTFEEIAAYAGPATMALGGNGAGSGSPEEVLGQSVTWNLLSMLGVAPVAGRTFLKEEEHPDSDSVVLSYGLWQRRFSGDPNLIGHSIFMGNRNLTVVGVMPAGFQFPDRRTEFWIPIGMSPQLLTRRNSHFLKVVGRMRTSPAAAQADMTSVANGLAAEYPGTNARVGITVVPLKDELLGETRTAFLILLSAAGCVLLIACANVGNLLLARASARKREISVRFALGATRVRLLRQIVTENLLLAGTGGALGLLFASWSLYGLRRMIPVGLADHLQLDLRVLAFTCGISILTGLLFGLAPALELSRIQLGSRTVTTHAGRLRDVLVIAEVAIALVLVVGAGLLIETLVRLRAVDAGFRANGILTADINVAFSKSQGRNRRFYDDVLARVRSIPGVKSAGLTSDLPYTSRGNTMSLAIEGNPAPPDLSRDTLFRLVSAGYLETIGAKLKEGRFLEARDRDESVPVVVINETLARQYFPNESALGHRIDTGTGDNQRRWMTIVGVVRDIRERGLDLVLKSAVYVPFPQAAITFFQPSEIAVLVSQDGSQDTRRDPLSLSKDLQQAVWSIDRKQPVSNIRTMDAIVDSELSNRTQILWLLGAFAALALLLAALGIYGVLSYVVSQRTREIGLRVAIGASQWDVVRMILGYSARLTAMGLGAGIAMAIAATRLLSTLLYGVSPLDIRTFLAVSTLLMLVALAASLIPTRRAAGVDPMIALREE
jgi:putative ABC transport system permease protein